MALIGAETLCFGGELDRIGMDADGSAMEELRTATGLH